jgi:SAM-dependent methyltransferase
VQGSRANRAFLRRAVRYLASHGVDQFLDLGAGLPAPGNVHEVAQAVNPAARVVYVDLDPMVLVHARALLAYDARTTVVPGDLRDPAAILADPDVGAHLDLSRPVAVLLVAVLHFVRDGEGPARIVADLRERLTPGSAVVISHVADLHDDERPERAAATREAAALYEELAGPFTLRAPDEIARLFTGLDVLDPGVVLANQWRPPRTRPSPPVPVLAGVGRVRDPKPPSPPTQD